MPHSHERFLKYSIILHNITFIWQKMVFTKIALNIFSHIICFQLSNADVRLHQNTADMPDFIHYICHNMNSSNLAFLFESVFFIRIYLIYRNRSYIIDQLLLEDLFGVVKAIENLNHLGLLQKGGFSNLTGHFIDS